MGRIPLDLLQTFELAARHQNFAHAARELHLTDSAVSHQMRRLEDALGYALFERRGRRVALTDAGRLLHHTVRDSLDTISSTMTMLRQRDGAIGGALVIGAPPMFASKWLASRLWEFARDHPSIKCSVRLLDNASVAEAAEIDIGITSGTGELPGKWSCLLAPIELSPVCSPRMLGGREGRIPDLSTLGDVLLLHQDDGTEWRRWLAAAGVGSRHRRSAPEMYFNDVSVAIDVALYGGGMALASDVTCSQHLRDGTLIRPFATKIATDLSWWLLCEPHRLAHPGAALFVEWLAGHFGIKELPSAPPHADSRSIGTTNEALEP